MQQLDLIYGDIMNVVMQYKHASYQVTHTFRAHYPTLITSYISITVSWNHGPLHGSSIWENSICKPFAHIVSTSQQTDSDMGSSFADKCP